MSGKSRLIEAIDATLMAPYRIMDKEGCDPHRFDGGEPTSFSRRVLNIVNFPETKTIFLAAACATASLSAQGHADRNIAVAKVAFLAAAYMGIRRKLEHPVLMEGDHKGPDYYLDPYPKGELSELSEEVETDLLLRESMGRLHLKLQIGASAGLAGLGLYTMGDPSPAILVAPFIVSSAGFSYRAQRVLDGDWDVLETKPEAESKPVSQAFAFNPA